MPSDGGPIHIRPAVTTDIPLILQFIRELAEYERLLHQVTATERDLREALFGRKPAAEAVIAEASGEAAGYALFVQNFSTFVGKPGLYLEDLYVRPTQRGRGIGRALLAHLAGAAVDRGYGRMEWSVLDWNETALKVYRAIGAVPVDDFTIQRLAGNDLQRLAAERQQRE